MIFYPAILSFSIAFTVKRMIFMSGICLKRIRIMNKREISEIKKQFKKDNNAITRICGCCVDAEKQIKTTLKEAFFALSEEEIF